MQRAVYMLSVRRNGFRATGHMPSAAGLQQNLLICRLLPPVLV